MMCPKAILVAPLSVRWRDRLAIKDGKRGLVDVHSRYPTFGGSAQAVRELESSASTHDDLVIRNLDESMARASKYAPDTERSGIQVAYEEQFAFGTIGNDESTQVAISVGSNCFVRQYVQFAAVNISNELPKSIIEIGTNSYSAWNSLHCGNGTVPNLEGHNFLNFWRFLKNNVISDKYFKRIGGASWLTWHWRGWIISCSKHSNNLDIGYYNRPYNPIDNFSACEPNEYSSNNPINVPSPNTCLIDRHQTYSGC